MEKNKFLQIYLSIMENEKKKMILVILVIFFLLLKKIIIRIITIMKKKNLVQKIWSGLLPISIARKICIAT